MIADTMKAPLYILAGLALLAASCSQPNTSPARGDAGAATVEHGKAPGLGEVMVLVGRRFELSGRAVLANRFELAEFEVGELEELFEGDVPGAELPKEGPTAHIPAMAQAFLKTNVAELKKAAATHDRKLFDDAFQHTAAACNGCHQASAKGFIEVPNVPGRSIPNLDPVASPVADASTGMASLVVRAVPLPGATGPASLDYIAYEAVAHGPGRVWVPVGATGSVDVLDITNGAFRRVDGFKTATRDVRGEKRTMGPSSVAIGDGFAFVGDRASNEVCAVDLKTLVRGACFTSQTGIDGVATVLSSRQVWVTTPSDESITVLDASSTGDLKLAGIVKVGGKPEGYAVDETRKLFFTNLEDKAKTVVIDVTKRTVKATWSNGCGEEGPRGLAVDSAPDLVMVACTDHVEVLDGGHDGALLAKLETGAGVDNIDYASASQTLYVAAGKAARMTVIHVGARGELTVTARTDTREGARNAVADVAGNIYVADAKGANLLVLSPQSKPSK